MSQAMYSRSTKGLDMGVATKSISFKKEVIDPRQKPKRARLRTEKNSISLNNTENIVPDVPD